MTLSLAPKTLNAAAPEPGIYPDVPSDVYHKLDLASKHRLDDVGRSPDHCRYNIGHPREITKDLKIGSALHATILEPKKFSDQYQVSGECDAILKTGERKGLACGEIGVAIEDGHWRCGRHSLRVSRIPAHQLLSEEECSTILVAADAVEKNRYASSLLAGAPERELTIIWDDKETGLRCKSRFDALSRSKGYILDLKTTRDASVDAFTRDAAAYGYHRQAAFYLRAAQAAGIDADTFTIIAVEKEPPYGVAIYAIEEEAIAVGMEELLPLMRIYAECERSGEWPGYPDGIQELNLPAWKRKRNF